MEFLLNHAYSFYFGFAAFLIFFVLLAKFGISPIVAAIDAREAKIASDVKSAQDAAEHATKLKNELDAQMRSVESKIAAMMAEANRDGEARKAALIEQSRTEIDAARHRAQRDIEAARQAAIVQIRAEIAEVATIVAEKILRSHIDPAKQEQLVAQAVEAYESASRGR
ncbi:MAG TPA: F0F1 ATP synthase subunit B [Planctomycetota bacterium]|nr:F0F1 ATP synthase subunit B [Planctomycetota bacterium]